jgi:5S rRNA maturation endonuclease (ribonuclease M5)
MDLKQIKNLLNDNIDRVFAELGVENEKFGDNIYCKCPVHESSDNPKAVSYSTSRKMWKCWTRDCQSEYGSDIFGLIRGALSNQTGEEVDFKQALKWACKLLNIKSNFKQQKTIEVTEDDLEKIIKIFNQQEKQHKQTSIDLKCDLSIPSEYFYGRGFNKKTLKHFGVGDCCEKGTLQDRAIIPIHNENGKTLVGAIGRATKEYRNPKFLIYPKGFDKRYYFYNYHRAIKKAEETSCLFILEGQGDVWRMYEAGVQNAVSLFGKTISEQHVSKLNKLAITNLVILMDNDQAGREARIQIQRQLGRMYKLIFPRLSNKDIGDMDVKTIKSEILSNLKGYY